tara:strand:+ start:338 stop:1309 length:972 start_codon:yes stop_codon:yes gene_type:complete
MILKQQEIPRLLNQYYPDIKDIKSVRELNTKSINSKNFLIITEKEKFVLKQFLDDISSQKMEKICKIIKYCVKKNIKISEPIYNIKKKFVIQKYKMYLLKYYEGEECSCTNEQTMDLAKNLALFHKELGKISWKYKFSRNRKRYRILNKNEISDIRKKIKRKKNLDGIDKQIMKKLDFFEECKSQIPKKSTNFQKIKTIQFIHGDLIPSNVIFRNNEVNTIIDIGSLRLGSVYEDLVQSSFRFSIKNTNNIISIKNKILVFLENYNYKKFEQLKFEQYQIILLKLILEKISFIIRERYFYKSNLWIKDLSKYFKFLDLSKNIL